jgi:tRNA uridine 5-carboxymethylaminomethyl modification enzyme
MKYDVAVIGGGHAGCEAALVTARRGLRTALITMDSGAIARMSCNPAIGGLGKGHLVREIDALGGEMGKVIDATGIQFRMLNRSKGPAVWSPRAQADRDLYADEMTERMLQQDDLDVLTGMVVELLLDGKRLTGVVLGDGTSLNVQCAILTAGTFLNARMFTGMNARDGGRYGEPKATGLSRQLHDLGFEIGRFKTGTPPRIYGDSINWSILERQDGDEIPQPFSYQTTIINRDQVPCHITHTNIETHESLKLGFDESPMFQGLIGGVGPRYCPSIEDKIARFPDKDRHQIFLEPEGLKTDLVYVNGFSTSLPEGTQDSGLRTIPGLEQCRVARYGYAVEYDYFHPRQLYDSMESQVIAGLFLAGQVNGTSGYEEAAAQGLIAGINASARILNEAPLVLKRSEAYIGVMQDDLITMELDEPYRMFTSRAEYRLLLRQDNADERLMKYGHGLGLIEDIAYNNMQQYYQRKMDAIQVLENIRFTPEQVNPILENIQSTAIVQSQSAAQLLKRPEVGFDSIKPLLNACDKWDDYCNVPGHLIEMEICYEGYIKRQLATIDKQKKMEYARIPDAFEYANISSMRREARERFSNIRPSTIGQAARLAGITPADISVLMIYVEKYKSMNHVSRETLQ